MHLMVSPEPTIFSAASFNCWGIPIPYVVKDYKIRMNAISEVLFKRHNFDVVCLQEVWSCADFEFFQTAAQYKLPYSHYFHSGVMGSGLCVFSKWPILDVLYHKWQVNGYVHKILHGDWYGGKGIGLCRLNVNGFKVNIYTCHTHAEYSENAEYIAHQVVQTYDVAQFIRVTSDNADLCVLAADLNTEPYQMCYRIIKNLAGLTDSFELSKLEWTGTFDCVRNSYSNSKVTKSNPHGVRIDYILYKPGKSTSVSCVAYDTPLESRVPGKEISYSDHEAISAKFKLFRCDPSETFVDSFHASIDAIHAVNEGYLICEKAVSELQKDICRIKLIIFLLGAFLCLTLITHVAFSLISNLALLLLVLIMTVIIFIFFGIYLWKMIECNSILCSLSSMKILIKNNNLLL